METGESRYIPPNTERFLPVQFEVPDLSPLKDGEYSRVVENSFPIEINGETYMCTGKFKREGDDEFTDSPLKIEMTLKDNGNFVGKFAGNVMKKNRYGTSSPYRDLVAPFVYIYTREVDDTYRGKSIGPTMLHIFEDTVKKINETYPELVANRIHMLAGVSSTTKMIIDQDWLSEHGLDEFKSTKGTNFGYMPHPSDEKKVENILRHSPKDISAAGNTYHQILFTKELT